MQKLIICLLISISLTACAKKESYGSTEAPVKVKVVIDSFEQSCTYGTVE